MTVLTDNIRLILRLGLAMALIAIVVVLQNETARDWGAALISNQIEAENAAYLDVAREAALHDMIVLAEVLAVLEIVESASIGFEFFVSAEIGAGKGISPLTRAVEWGLLGAGIGVLLYEAIALALIAASAVAPILFQLMLLSTALALLAAPLHKNHILRSLLGIAARVTTLAFLTVFLLLPYSVNIAGSLAALIPLESYQPHDNAPDNLHAHLVADSEGPPGFDTWTSRDVAQRFYASISSNLRHSVSQIKIYAIKSLAMDMLIGLVLPLLLLTLGLRLLRRVMRDADAHLRKPHRQRLSP